MQGTVLDVAQTPHHVCGAVADIRIGRRSGVPLPAAAAGNAHAIVERVLNCAHLDAATRSQMVRILTVTVREWARK